MLGGAFFDLLPEAAEIQGIAISDISIYMLCGVIIFFITEKLIHWYHCRHEKCSKMPITYLSLMADSVHNFLDGVAIAISFLVNVQIGIAVTLTVIFHEIPQEISDYSILIYGGFGRLKALALNFVTALSAFIGALFAYFFSTSMGGVLTAFLLAFSGGGFIYMASANLIPELHKEKDIGKSVVQVF